VSIGGPAVAVSAGEHHSCALLGTGAVRCWGNNEAGQLGYATTNPIGDDELPSAAGDVVVGGGAVQISTAHGMTCALLATGAVRCWGQGDGGALGYGNTRSVGDDESPASVGDVNVGAPVAEVSAGGSHTCALLGNGNVRCWGFGGAAFGYLRSDAIGDDEAPATAGDIVLGF
jgi:alpha-tubulin suppressor-like RCC1 family protein